MSCLLGIMDFGLELSKKYRVISTLVFDLRGNFLHYKHLFSNFVYSFIF